MLYGRAAELAEIDCLIAGARAGTGGVLVLRGEAGIGKTALLEYAAQAGPVRELRVLRAAGHPGEAEQPFASLELLLRRLRSGVDELLHDALGSAAADRFAIRRTMLSLLSEHAAARPLLCVVDDAQWLDPASADVLAFAARRFAVERIALVLAARDGELPMAAGLPERRLGRLDPAAALDLLRARVPAAAPPAVERIVAESAGNPLALYELAAAMTAGQRAGRLNPFVFHDGTMTIAGKVQEEYRARLAGLPASTRALLLAAAADDTRDLATVSNAAAALGAGQADLARAEHAGLLQVIATTVAFPHPLLRAAIYHDATTVERRAAHRAIAGTLADDLAERRAWHQAAATSGADEEVAAELAAIAGHSDGPRACAAYERAA